MQYKKETKTNSIVYLSTKEIQKIALTSNLIEGYKKISQDKKALVEALIKKHNVKVSL